MNVNEFTKYLKELNIDISEENLRKFQVYSNLLKEYNKKFNITRCRHWCRVSWNTYCNSKPQYWSNTTWIKRKKMWIFKNSKRRVKFKKYKNNKRPCWRLYTKNKRKIWYSNFPCSCSLASISWTWNTSFKSKWLFSTFKITHHRRTRK